MKCLFIHEVKGTDSKITHKRVCFRVTLLVGDNSVIAVTPRNEGENYFKRFYMFPFSYKSIIYVHNVSRVIFFSRLFLKKLLILHRIGGSGSLLPTSFSAH